MSVLFLFALLPVNPSKFLPESVLRLRCPRPAARAASRHGRELGGERRLEGVSRSAAAALQHIAPPPAPAQPPAATRAADFTRRHEESP